MRILHRTRPRLAHKDAAMVLCSANAFNLSLQRSYLRAFSSRWELNDLAAPGERTHTTIYEKKHGSKSMKWIWTESRPDPFIPFSIIILKLMNDPLLVLWLPSGSAQISKMRSHNKLYCVAQNTVLSLVFQHFWELTLKLCSSLQWWSSK